MKRLLVLVTALLLAACSSGGGTSAPSFARFTPDQALAALRSAGLEVGDTHPMTKDDYGLAPLVATGGIRFLIPSLGADKGGRIMAFKSQEDLDRTKAYYDDLAKGSAIFFSWTFVHANVLVQINGDLPEPQARAYESALVTLG